MNAISCRMNMRDLTVTVVTGKGFRGNRSTAEQEHAFLNLSAVSGDVN